jgi:hypothetical protein
VQQARDCTIVFSSLLVCPYKWLIARFRALLAVERVSRPFRIAVVLIGVTCLVALCSEYLTGALDSMSGAMSEA